MLNQMLANAGVAWRVAVEAGGWELMLHFASLGIGLAIVNGCCRLPPGLVAKPLEELPRVRYQVLQRAGSQPHAGVADLRSRLLINSDAWRLETEGGV
jgi:DNA-binding transcriptional LysR family regulator